MHAKVTIKLTIMDSWLYLMRWLAILSMLD